MAYIIHKNEDGVERNQVVMDYQGAKKAVAIGFTIGSIESVLEVDHYSIVRDVVPLFHEGSMSIVKEKDYTRSDSEVSAEIYALFVENSCSEEIFECFENEESLRSALTSHLSVGNSILSIFKISRTNKEYQELKVEIDGFKLNLK